MGHPPFTGTNREKLYEYILNVETFLSFFLMIFKAEPQYPKHLSKNIKDLLTKLLTKDPAKRLGANGAEEIKKHPAFEGVKWDEDSQLKRRPPFVPILTKPNDLRYFDKVCFQINLRNVLIKIIGIFKRNSRRDSSFQFAKTNGRSKYGFSKF